MPSEEMKRAEYESLNKEIQENSTKVYQVLAGCIVSTTGLISYVFTVKPTNLPFEFHSLPCLLLLPFLIIVPSVLLVQSSLHSTIRIASYLMMYHECGDSSVAWQTSMQQYREYHKDKGKHKARPYRRSLVAVFGGLSVISALSSLLSFSYVISSQQTCGDQRTCATFIIVYLAFAVSLFTLVFIFLRKMIKEWEAGSFSAEVTRWKAVKASTDTKCEPQSANVASGSSR